MTEEQVMEMLKAYRFELGRCGHLRASILQLDKEYKQTEFDLVDAMVSPGAQKLTDMPRGTDIGNPTERYGLRLAEGLESGELTAIKVKIDALKNELEKRQSTVMFVESWLSGLTERERWVVEQQVIDGVFWKDVCSRYRQHFEEDCSKDTLKRCRAKALGKIFEMAK